MNIIPIEIRGKLLFENRHLFTDDSQYNSLIISNLINKNVILLDVYIYHTLDYDIKKYVFDVNPRFNYILNKTDGLYRQRTSVHSYTLEFFNRSFLIGWTTQMIDILTIVNEE